MHTLSYLKVLRKLGLQDTEAGNTEQTISELEERWNDQVGHTKLHAKLGLETKRASKAGRYLEELVGVQEPWARFLGCVELWFIIFGTIQWGYGNKWVEILHSTEVKELIKKALRGSICKTNMTINAKRNKP